MKPYSVLYRIEINCDTRLVTFKGDVLLGVLSHIIFDFEKKRRIFHHFRSGCSVPKKINKVLTLHIYLDFTLLLFLTVIFNVYKALEPLDKTVYRLRDIVYTDRRGR